MNFLHTRANGFYRAVIGNHRGMLYIPQRAERDEQVIAKINRLVPGVLANVD